MSDNETLDAVKYHLGNGADQPETAGWPIATFLLWCAERGLLSPSHAAAEVRADPTRYLLDRCGAKLWLEDLTPEGAAFARQQYENYIAEIEDLAEVAGVSFFEIGRREDAAEIRAAAFEFLDDAWDPAG